MILASQSPRRKELLSFIAEDFKIIPAVGEEKIPNGTLPQDAVVMLAQQKAREIRAAYKDETIIAADTVVVVDNDILGKPKSEQQASEMLRRLSGRKHSVLTGVCIIFADGAEKSFYEQTLVEFYPLSEQEIQRYIATGEPMDKAGAYGIQGRGSLLIKRFEGDYFNVVGLPVARLSRELGEL